MKNYEIDRLFGQAITDQRFFRQLCEQPTQVLAQFALDEHETQAVLGIALQVSTVGELATQLDDWMMQHTVDASTSLAAPQRVPAMQSLSPMHRADLDPPQLTHQPIYQPRTELTPRRNEQTLCLTLSEYVPQS